MLWIFFSVGSSNSSHSNSRDQSHRDERLETHLEAEQSEDEDEFIDNDFKGKICWKKICPSKYFGPNYNFFLFFRKFKTPFWSWKTTYGTSNNSCLKHWFCTTIFLYSFFSHLCYVLSSWLWINESFEKIMSEYC